MIALEMNMDDFIVHELDNGLNKIAEEKEPYEKSEDSLNDSSSFKTNSPRKRADSKRGFNH